MICKYCGEEFEPNKRGRQSECCAKDECKKKKHVEQQKAYIERKKAKEGMAKTTKKVEKIQEAKKDYEYVDKTSSTIVCRKEVSGDYGDIIEISRQIGAIRYDLINKILKIKDETRKTDQVEQDLLHMLENAEELTDADAIRISVLIKQNRNQRREYKDRLFLLTSLTNGLTIKNPEKFVRKGIEMVENQTYNYRILEDMLESKEDKEEMEEC